VVQTCVALSYGRYVDSLGHQRHLVMHLYLWHSGNRSKEGGELSLPDLHDEATGAPLFPPGPLQWMRLIGPAPEVIKILPTHGTKTNKGGREYQSSILIRRQVAPVVTEPLPPEMCFVHQLWTFLRRCLLSRMAVTHYVLRPLARDGTHFTDAPYSTSSFGHHLTTVLTTLGIYGGETPHSYRRGTLQHTYNAAGHAAAAALGRIATPAVVDRYLCQDRCVRARHQ
jgi:hypothetical protein